MPKRPLTPQYILFYLLFWPDTWRAVLGIVLATWLSPVVIRSGDVSGAGRPLIWFMLAVIGWAVTGWPGRRIAAFWRRVVLPGRR